MPVDNLTPDELARMEAGLSPPEEAFEEASADLIDAEQEQIEINIPVGTWTLKRLEALKDSLNKFFSEIGSPPIETELIEGKNVPLNDALFAGLLAFKAVAEAFGDYDIKEIIDYASDADIAQAAAVIAQAMGDRSFKEFLKTEAPPEEEVVEEVIEEPVIEQDLNEEQMSELALL